MGLTAYQLMNTHAERLRKIFMQMVAAVDQGTSVRVVKQEWGSWTNTASSSYNAEVSCLADSRDLQLTPYSDEEMLALKHRLHTLKAQLNEINNTVPLHDVRLNYKEAQHGFPVSVRLNFRTFDDLVNDAGNFAAAHGNPDAMYIMVQIATANGIDLTIEPVEDSLWYTTTIDGVEIRYFDPDRYMICVDNKSHRLVVNKRLFNGHWLPVKLGDDVWRRFVYGFGLNDVLGEGNPIVTQILDKGQSGYDDKLPLTWNAMLDKSQPALMWYDKLKLDAGDLPAYLPKLYLWDAYVAGMLIKRGKLAPKYWRQLEDRMRRHERMMRQPFFAKVPASMASGRVGSRRWLYEILAATEFRERYQGQCHTTYARDDSMADTYIDKHGSTIYVQQVLFSLFWNQMSLGQPVHLYKHSVASIWREAQALEVVMLVKQSARDQRKKKSKRRKRHG